MSPTTLKGPELPSASGITRRLVIFLHGLGADGDDLLGLAPLLDLPDTHFMAPNAPFPCDMAPYGYQWFSLRDRNPARVVTEIAAATPSLDALIDAAMARFNLAAKDVALIGFSQGTMMALHVAPRRAEALAGVVGFSGALMEPPLFAAEIRSHPPVCLIHGTADEVVPFASMAVAQSALATAGITAETHARPGLGHGIDEEGIALTVEFLKRVLAV